MTGTRFTVEVRPRIPPELARLQELASDLYFSWDRYTRGLFYYLDPVLWEECRHNPKLFLRRVSQKRLEEALRDRAFLEEFGRTLAYYDVYQKETRRQDGARPLEGGLVAYFCAEFGLHESLPIYSGGLGILAGDFCKAASDIVLPFVAVGLFYRAGNLVQVIDEHGNQQTYYEPVDPEDLPIRPARGPDGSEVVVTVELPHGSVRVAVWHAKAGHTDLYLLDTDHPGNAPQDRSITQQLYPADKEARLRQEMIMGIGGVRALRALGLAPTIWHINEGHPCLLLLERCRELVHTGMDFHAALEVVAAASVFTTHTPVAAGHQVYDTALVRAYLSGMIRELGVSETEFLALGANSQGNVFNLTTFSLRCCNYHNAVSRIHRRVAAELEKHVWPEIPVDENPMESVTNGIHVPTFLARNWFGVLEDPGWHNEMLNADYWRCIEAIPDATFWGVRMSLKAALLAECRRVTEQRCRRLGQSESQIECATALLCRADDVMVIGFARRFATYKRATLLFDDPERLQRLLTDPKRPVLLIFAGRAHPNDEPGKDLIRRIHDFSRQPGFLGHILLLEGYDLALGRKLVSGADLWVNVPEYPLEASGTSGMKAAINGSVNLSILDGWWAEGFNGRNGWGLQPHAAEPNPDVRRHLEAKELLDTLEQQVLPLYFNRTAGYSEGWVRLAKESMMSVIPRFNAQRMVRDYLTQFYLPAVASSKRLLAEQGAGAARLASWKMHVRRNWPGLSLRRVATAGAALHYDEAFTVTVAVNLNGLRESDIVVECLLGRPGDRDKLVDCTKHVLAPSGMEGAETLYRATIPLALSGLVAYKIRAYPFHALLCRRFEMGYMKWA
jgi:starch phosphorylase